MIAKKILEIIRCPLGKAELTLEDEFLICSMCGVKFPVRNGILVLLIDEAELPDAINNINKLNCQIIKNK